MSARGVDEIAQAHHCFRFWRESRVHERHPAFEPLTPASKRSLQHFAKALDKLDPKARWRLAMTLDSVPENIIDKMRTGVDALLTSKSIYRRRGGTTRDTLYKRGVKHLVRAWEATHNSSPLTQLQDFQDFAREVTKNYPDVPVPGEKEIRPWVKGRRT